MTAPLPNVMDVDALDALLRPFGEVVDLDVDFDQPDRPDLVTQLLAQCDVRRDPALWWSQPVGRRIAALLRLVAVTEQRDELSLSARCTEPGCGESFEFELPLRLVAGSSGEIDPVQVRLGDDRALTMRRPTGDDLRRWRAAHPASRADALRLMLDALVVAGRALPEDEPTVSASITALDPLVDFTVACLCPACGAPNEVPIDLETVALSRLVARQRALLWDIHRFASRYGWTEAQVLAVPPARRARYLTLMEEAIS